MNHPEIRAIAAKVNLKLDECQLDDEHAKIFSHSTTIVSLDLTNNNVTDQGVCALVNIPSLTRLNLWGNNIIDQGLVALGLNTTLLSLGLSFTVTANVNVESVDVLTTNTIITALVPFYNQVYCRDEVLRSFTVLNKDNADRKAHIMSKVLTVWALMSSKQ